MFKKLWMRYALMEEAGGEGGAGGASEGAGSGAGEGGEGGAAAGGASSAAGAAAGTGSAGDASAAAAAGGAAGKGGAAAGAGKSGKGSEGGYWPDDWRDKAAAGDDKALARLSRYATPAEVAKALIAAQNKISAGELKPVLGKNASAEEVAAFRSAHGIPEAPEKYDLDLGAGMVVGEEDKPLIEKFLKVAHATNQTPDQVKASLRAYYDLTEAETARRTEQDATIQTQAEDTLRTEWGPEFRRNINLIHGLLDKTSSPELKEKFLGGRLADGTPIGSSPEALKMLLGLALTDNPAGTVVPSGGANMMQSLDDEIGKIEETMKKNRTAYNKDEKMQTRYRELLGAREQMKNRKAA